MKTTTNTTAKTFLLLALLLVAPMSRYAYADACSNPQANPEYGDDYMTGKFTNDPGTGFSYVFTPDHGATITTLLDQQETTPADLDLIHASLEKGERVIVYGIKDDDFVHKFIVLHVAACE